MVELLRANNLIEPDLEYDLTWSKGEEYLNKFTGGEFDDETKGEYECIQAFLDDKLKPKSGYYAEEKVTGNLILFQWGENDQFYTKTANGYQLDNPSAYEIIQIEIN